MPFDSQITEITTEQLDQLFDSTPESTPSADTLAVSKEDTNGMLVSQDSGTIPFYNPATDDQVDTTVTDKVDDSIETTTPDDSTESATEPTDDSKEPVVDTTETTDPAQVNTVLKNTVDYLVSSGKWVDFEGREDLDITEDVYAELTAKQDEYRVNSLFSELVDNTGEYGKAIFEHIKKGGNPDEIIDIFKEEKQLAKLDTSTEDGKQSLIEKYYKDVLGWKSEKVDKIVKRLITDDGIDEEFTDVKEMYDDHYKSRLKELDTQAQEREQKQQKVQQEFVTNIRSAIDSNEGLSQSDKTFVADSILNFKHKLQSGQKVNDFYLKFAEVQSNPSEYIDLVSFVMDKKRYIDNLKRKQETKANVKAYNFIKGNAAVAKPKSSEITINDNPGKTQRGTDFSFALKK